MERTEHGCAASGSTQRTAANARRSITFRTYAHAYAHGSVLQEDDVIDLTSDDVIDLTSFALPEPPVKRKVVLPGNLSHCLRGESSKLCIQLMRIFPLPTILRWVRCTMR